MALATYSDLITSVQNWMGRSGDTALAAVTPDLILLAEQDMYTRLRLPENEKLHYIRYDETYEELPSDWLEGVEVRVIGTTGYPLRYQSPQIFDDLNSRTTRTATSNATPTYYTIRNTKIQLDSFPSTVDSVTVSSATSSGTTVTLQMAAEHELSTGNYITVTDSASEGYAGTFKVASVPTVTSITYTVDTAPSASPATGTIAYTVNNLEIDYFYKFNNLNSTNTTNSILTNYPDIYLYACLHQAAVWNQSIEQAEGYYVKYIDAIEKANMRAMDRLVSGSQMEMYTQQGYADAGS